MKDDNEKVVDADIEFARKQYYDLLEQGQEGLELMMQILQSSEHPRSGEVFAQMLKQNADITEKIIDLNKKEKQIKQMSTLPVPQQQGAVPSSGNTTNNVFVGTTEELQRLLQGDSLTVEKDVTPKE